MGRVRQLRRNIRDRRRLSQQSEQTRTDASSHTKATSQATSKADTAAETTPSDAHAAVATEMSGGSMEPEVEEKLNAEKDVAMQNDVMATVETETKAPIYDDAEARADAEVVAKVLAAAAALQVGGPPILPPASLAGGTDGPNHCDEQSATPLASVAEGTHDANADDKQAPVANTVTKTGYGKLKNRRMRYHRGPRYSAVTPIDNRPVAKCGGFIQCEHGSVLHADMLCVTNIRKHRSITSTNKMTYLNTI